MVVSSKNFIALKFMSTEYFDDKSTTISGCFPWVWFSNFHFIRQNNNRKAEQTNIIFKCKHVPLPFPFVLQGFFITNSKC
jgi:hypothetical protein